MVKNIVYTKVQIKAVKHLLANNKLLLLSFLSELIVEKNFYFLTLKKNADFMG